MKKTQLQIVINNVKADNKNLASKERTELIQLNTEKTFRKSEEYLGLKNKIHTLQADKENLEKELNSFKQGRSSKELNNNLKGDELEKQVEKELELVSNDGIFSILPTI